MNNIVIAIPTYKRPIMVRKLILSIVDLNVDKSLIKSVSIVVVDNDIERTAEKTINKLIIETKGIYKLYYSNYAVKGLSNVRNELLRKSFELTPDYIVFIDDDEFVTSEWLNELVKTITFNHADVARGPAFAELVNNIPDNIACWFKRENFPDNLRLNTLTTGNLILRTSSLQKFNVWFDNRFNKTGSEDSYFGIQLLKKGATIYWSAKAIIYETIPEKRANIKWLIIRSYRVASTYSYLLKFEKHYLKLLKKIMVSFIYIIFGFCALVLLIIPIKMKYWGILKLSEGIGGLSGLVGNLYNEYE
jgi:succinoglycan biosynthesis protein ExoM